MHVHITYKLMSGICYPLSTVHLLSARVCIQRVLLYKKKSSLNLCVAILLLLHLLEMLLLSNQGDFSKSTNECFLQIVLRFLYLFIFTMLKYQLQFIIIERLCSSYLGVNSNWNPYPYPTLQSCCKRAINSR